MSSQAAAERGIPRRTPAQLAAIDPRLAAATRARIYKNHEARIRKIADSIWLTDEQRARLALILQPSQSGDGDGAP